ncbi:SDR family NAD(P)-dependent oxidoreductase [Flavitalea flava]
MEATKGKTSGSSGGAVGTNKFKDRTVVITGSGSGIGRACALEFAREGANLVIADIDLEGARQTVSLIEDAGGHALAVKTDVSEPGSVKQLAELVIKKYGSIHTLVNNAAIQVNKTVEHTTWEEWNRQLSINLGGVFLCSKYFLPHLRESKGSIVNMSSVNGFFVEPTCAGYCATKAAIIGLTKAMAIDHGQDGIRVNCICPGYIDSGLAEEYFRVQQDPVKARSEAGKLHALNRIGKPEEVGKLAVFLASDDASFITGSSMVVDGGFGSGLPPKF